MKVKVNEASGPVLDWMVAKCEGREQFFSLNPPTETREHCFSRMPFSTDWSQGGPIIERGRIELHNANAVDCSGEWVAHAEFQKYAYGPTPLIAAMRCFVVSKLGEEVDVPEELCEKY